MADPRVQLIVAKLGQETSRANNEALAKTAAEANRDEWKAIANKERARGDQLEIASAARREEAGELRASIGFLRTSNEEYKKELNDTRLDLIKANSSKKWWFGAGAAGGIIACMAANR